VWGSAGAFIFAVTTVGDGAIVIGVGIVCLQSSGHGGLAPNNRGKNVVVGVAHVLVFTRRPSHGATSLFWKVFR